MSLNNDDLYAVDDADEEEATAKKAEGKFFDSNYLDEEKSNESEKVSVENDEIDDFEPAKNLDSKKKKNRIQEDDDDDDEKNESVLEDDEEETKEKPSAFNKLKQLPTENEDNENEGFFEEEAALSGKLQNHLSQLSHFWFIKNKNNMIKAAKKRVMKIMKAKTMTIRFCLAVMRTSCRRTPNSKIN